MSGELKPMFRLLQGGSSGTAARRSTSAELKLVRPADELARPGFPGGRIGTNSVVSVGYEGMTQETLEVLLSAYRPSLLVDIRISPSFHNHRISRERVARSLTTHNVGYLHLPGLANRFVGDSLDFRQSLERYACWVGRNEQLFDLRNLIDRGPILLLSGVAAHEPSERSVLVDELRRRWPSFEVVVPA